MPAVSAAGVRFATRGSVHPSSTFGSNSPTDRGHAPQNVGDRPAPRKLLSRLEYRPPSGAQIGELCADVLPRRGQNKATEAVLRALVKMVQPRDYDAPALIATLGQIGTHKETGLSRSTVWRALRRLRGVNLIDLRFVPRRVHGGRLMRIGILVCSDGHSFSEHAFMEAAADLGLIARPSWPLSRGWRHDEHARMAMVVGHLSDGNALPFYRWARWNVAIREGWHEGVTFNVLRAGMRVSPCNPSPSETIFKTLSGSRSGDVLSSGPSARSDTPAATPSTPPTPPPSAAPVTLPTPGESPAAPRPIGAAARPSAAARPEKAAKRVPEQRERRREAEPRPIGGDMWRVMAAGQGARGAWAHGAQKPAPTPAVAAVSRPLPGERNPPPPKTRQRAD